MNQIQIITTVLIALIVVFFLFPPYCGDQEHFNSDAAALGGLDALDLLDQVERDPNIYNELDFKLEDYPDLQPTPDTKCPYSQDFQNKPRPADSAVGDSNLRRAELIELMELQRDQMLNQMYPSNEQYMQGDVDNRLINYSPRGKELVEKIKNV